MRSRLQRRLELLTGGAADLPPRQRTLRGAIDWTYSLLDETERLAARGMLVRRLASVETLGATTVVSLLLGVRLLVRVGRRWRVALLAVVTVAACVASTASKPAWLFTSC